QSHNSCLLAFLVTQSSADTSVPLESESQAKNPEPAAAPFETSHKHPEAEARQEEGFHTSHRISIRATDPADYSMNLLPTKERPELNPVLSALINEDVMKSIEAKRAIEEEELAEVRREIEEAAQRATASTEAPAPQLTTLPTAAKKIDSLDEDVVVDPHEEFVNQNFALEGAGSENSKKSRIEIKKGPNGQDYEYEYVYYYEEDEEQPSSPPKAEAPVESPETRGKTRYTNIERSTPATPSENSLQSGKAKGRSSETAEDIEAERLPMITRFPSRGKNIEQVPPTPALDSLETAAERKKISVKRPSLELVDSETFNTDEKQTKASRKGGENDLKPVIAIEQEQAAAAEAARKKELELEKTREEVPSPDQEEAEQTTPSMEKAALDLYAILTNENLNNEQTTAIADAEGAADRFTTLVPDTASTDEDDAGLTTLTDEISSTSSTTTTTTTSTTTTTTTTTEAPTTTTTTTTAAPSLYGGRRSGLSGLAGRNRFKLREGGISTTTSTTEAPAPTETTKTGRNRFSRPSIGGRSRPGARTTASPEAAPSAAPAGEEEAVVAKEVKPISSGFARGRPRNRFNLRGSTTTSTTERPSGEEGGAAGAEGDSAGEAAPSSTTARSTLRGRPGLGLRGRSRTTTTKAPAADGASGDSEGGNSSSEAAPAPAPAEPVRPSSRFNLHRAGGNRLLPRGKLGRGATAVTTEAPKEAAAAAAEDSAADSSSHHNDVKEEEGGGGEKETAGSEGGGEAPAPAAGPVTGLNRLKTRPRLNALHKTDAAKPKAAAAPASAPAHHAPAPRKINPLLAKRRLHLAGATSTTEAPAEEEHSSSSDASVEQPAKEDAPSDESIGADGAAAKAEQESATESAESTTKQQARGLGLLGQRRRLPLRKPGTIL
ncbi:hypothetical protein KR054_001925, partial [Drosophila jambulina]